MGGWIPRSEDEKSQVSRTRALRGDGRVGMYEEGNDGLVALQEGLEEAAAAVKATTTAMENKIKFTVPDEIREMAAEAAKCRDPVRVKLLRKTAHEARREFDAGTAAFPRVQAVQRPVVTKLWVKVWASEDKDKWTEEVRYPL